MDEIIYTSNVKRLLGDPKEWPTYKKTTLTHMTKVEGTFAVDTQHGMVRCEDGYVALDSQGMLYPVSENDFENTYEKVEE
jgi:hypothetical protein